MVYSVYYCRDFPDIIFVAKGNGFIKMMPEEQEELQRLLEDYRTEHRDLDVVIQQLAEAVPVDFLRLQRMKKRKLFLKDSISKIESMLLPDIIA